MSNLGNVYSLEQQTSAEGVTFFFVSKGKQDIIKVIQYAFVQKLNDKKVYNLGFGDYDIESDNIVDNINTNNGDAYKVFNTVLTTISVFFEYYPHAMLMVQGSDGRPEFIEICRKTCSKRCESQCKNFNRRIDIYRHYVDKNYHQLIAGLSILRRK